MEVFPKHSQELDEKQKIQVLDEAYRQTMERINGQKSRFKKLAMDVLAWITCSKRQLTTSELRHALATKTGKSEFHDGDLIDIGDMVSVCAGLVTVDEESSIIRLVHYTTQQYLEKTQDTWFPDAESTITIVCVTYLSFSVFETGFCEAGQEFEERLRLYPLYEYAARNWGHHARKDVKPSQESSDVVISFLENKAKVEASSQALMADDKLFSLNYNQIAPRKMTGLHLAAYFGITEAAVTLLRFGYSTNLKDTYRRAPLWYAAQNGHVELVDKLLAAGADANAGTNRGTALLAAAGGGHLEVVDKLLAAGADVNADGNADGWTALQVAAGGGHLEVVGKLLAAGAYANALGLWGGTALQEAARRGHLEIVDKLVAAGANANAWTNRGTVLLAAARGGYLEVVDKLLAAGADANADAKADGWTALRAAAGGGHLEVVNKLLAAGADANADRGTILQEAARGGYLEVVERLKAAGALR